VTRSRYAKALHEALTPLGFIRHKDDWVRIRGEIWECVNRQSSWVGAGVTANLMVRNLETERLYVEIFQAKGVIGMPWGASTRIGTLIDGYDRWWPKDEPDGPMEMADAVLQFGIPWFDRVRSLEEQAELWYGREGAITRRGYHGPSLVGLALTLFRMGEFDEALEVTKKPVPRTAIASSVEMVAQVRAWLERQLRKSLD